MSAKAGERPAAAASVILTLDPETLRPLIAEVVAEALDRIEAQRAQIAGDLCYLEEEAAGLLKVEPHVLRDERRRGRIRASQIVGRRIRYTRDDLIGYLMGRRSAEQP